MRFALFLVALFFLGCINPPEVSKQCDTPEDCVPVGCECTCSGCGGFSYEDIVNKDSVDAWYLIHDCSPPQVCPEVCCPPMEKVCENNVCAVKQLNSTDY